MTQRESPVAPAVSFLRKATGQVAAVRRALEQSVEHSMAAPGGEEWEHQVSEPEPEELEPAGPPPTPPPWEQERKAKQAAEFKLNWFGRLRRRRRRGS